MKTKYILHLKSCREEDTPTYDIMGLKLKYVLLLRIDGDELKFIFIR